MSGYGIFRCEKLKTMGNLLGSLKHAFREQLTLNANPIKLHDNVLLTPDTPNSSAVMAKYHRLKPEKIRNDQVRAIEVLVTASPQAMEYMTKDEQIEYLKKSLDFANNEFGESNLLHAQIHYDETTPHLTAFYIPRIVKDTKKGSRITLNAKELLGGRKEYSDRQSRFYELVSRDYGLLRGEVGSKATHKKISDYYRDVNKHSENFSKSVEELEEMLEEKDNEMQDFLAKTAENMIYMITAHPNYGERKDLQDFLTDLEDKMRNYSLTTEDFSQMFNIVADMRNAIFLQETELKGMKEKLSPPTVQQKIKVPSMGM